MKAIAQDRYGSADVLELREVDAPAVGANDVLVEVRAASVNAADWHLMRGDPRVARPAMGWGGPRVKVRGRDFAGHVRQVGADVTRLRVGDEVFGVADGTFAELVRVPADGAVEPKPAGLTFEQAAAMPLAGVTALIGLRDAARLRAGQRVLVNGASGGVGTFAVQIAKALGAAEVTGVCRTRNVDLIRSLGADNVVDYTRQDFTLGADRYDVVFDLVGNHSLTALRRVLTPTGTLVLTGGGVFSGGSLFGPLGLLIRGRLLSPFVRHRLIQFIAAPTRAHLATLRDLADAGSIIPAVDRTYPLERAPEAIRHLEGEHARAKVVITM